jgi:hypothetical protein
MSGPLHTCCKHNHDDAACNFHQLVHGSTTQTQKTGDTPCACHSRAMQVHSTCCQNGLVVCNNTRSIDKQPCRTAVANANCLAKYRNIQQSGTGCQKYKENVTEPPAATDPQHQGYHSQSTPSPSLLADSRYTAATQLTAHKQYCCIQLHKLLQLKRMTCHSCTQPIAVAQRAVGDLHACCESWNGTTQAAVTTAWCRRRPCLGLLCPWCFMPSFASSARWCISSASGSCSALAQQVTKFLR